MSKLKEGRLRIGNGSLAHHIGIYSQDELVLGLHDYFTAFEQTSERSGLEKLKTIGGGFTCGHPFTFRGVSDCINISGRTLRTGKGFFCLYTSEVVDGKSAKSLERCSWSMISYRD